MKTTVGHTAKVAAAAATVTKLLGKSNANGATFLTHTIRDGIKALEAKNDFGELADALRVLVSFGVSLNDVEINIK